MKALRRIVPRRAQWQLVGVNSTVVIMTAVITAFLALVVEDLLPRTDADGLVVPLRAWLLLAAVLFLIFVLGWRAVVQDKKGTLFYVQALDESMASRHDDYVADARDERMALRSLTRWASLTSRTHGGVIDVVDQAHEIGHALEDAINEDRAGTGYTVAPNLLWPMALAVGAYLPQTDRLRLMEFVPKGNGKPATRIEFPLTEAKPTDLIEVKPEAVPEAQGERVGVWLALTTAAQHFSPEGFAAFGVSTVHVVSYRGKLPGRDDYVPDFDQTEVQSFGPRIAAILHDIKSSSEDRELVVVAMIPKVTALAAGWHLSQIGSFPFFPGTHLMHHDQTSGYIPMRVRESQPTTPPQPAAPDGESLKT